MNIVKERLISSFEKFNKQKCVAYESHILTFGEIYNYAQNLAKKFAQKEISPVITIYMNRSVEAVIAVLAAILADKIFCAIDVNTSYHKFNEILNETESNTIIYNNKNFFQNKESNALYLNIELSFYEKELKVFQEGEIKKISNINYHNDVSHIIYTSGSTNIPKGVLASKKALIHFIDWEFNLLKPKDYINTAQISAPWFDPFARDVFLPLFYGGCICIPNKRQMFDPNSFQQFASHNNINVLHIVPTLFRQLFINGKIKCEVNYSINNILLAGEMVYGEDIRVYLAKHKDSKLYNLYGPTETTMSKFYHCVKADDIYSKRVHVGMPLPDSYCKIINDDGVVLDYGNEGEILIVTKYASLGYLKRDELNKQKFIHLNDGYVEYHTDDIGILHSANDLEIIGRKDNMKKIYGQKIYAEEIEEVALKCNGVNHCIARINGNNISILIETDNMFSFENLEEILNMELLAYKIPQEVIIVKNMPLNKNGKVDRKGIEIENSYEILSVEKINLKEKK